MMSGVTNPPSGMAADGGDVLCAVGDGTVQVLLASA